MAVPTYEMGVPGLESQQEPQVLGPTFAIFSDTFMQKKLCQVKNIFFA